MRSMMLTMTMAMTMMISERSQKTSSTRNSSKVPQQKVSNGKARAHGKRYRVTTDSQLSDHGFDGDSWTLA